METILFSFADNHVCSGTGEPRELTVIETTSLILSLGTTEPESINFRHVREQDKGGSWPKSLQGQDTATSLNLDIFIRGYNRAHMCTFAAKGGEYRG